MTSRYQLHSSQGKVPKLVIIVIAAVMVLILGAVVLRRSYDNNLKPASASQRRVLITIPKNSSLRQIATQLKKLGIIRSDRAFEWYVRSHELYADLQAGTYSLSPSQSVADIVNILTQGKVSTALVTILPGQRLDQIRKSLISYGFTETTVDKALSPAQYKNHPALADKPPEASLEGYLYPESFQKTAETTPQQIISKSLDEMQKRLTPDIREGIIHQGLTVHEGIILASIVEQEVSKPSDRAMVAQVFLRRRSQDMPLESDPTAYYGAIVANQTPSLAFDSPYNTRLHKGLPPSPISNVTDSSLAAVAHPAPTDFLYFVSGDDGVTYFSHTLEEHQALTAQHCKKLCNSQ